MDNLLDSSIPLSNLSGKDALQATKLFLDSHPFCAIINSGSQVQADHPIVWSMP
jgi:hypothetical protein